MNKKVYDPFTKMNKKQLAGMGEVEPFSRNLKKKEKKSAGNFLHLPTKKAS